LIDAGGQYTEWFTQEVRRFYPSFPAVAARVRSDFDWNGYRFPSGRRTMLDLYGTNHDVRTWDAPDAFRPERFRDATPTAYAFVPQRGAISM
jgi:fatty-acid peroxygenase